MELLYITFKQQGSAVLSLDATAVNTAFTEITEISFAGVVKIAVSLQSPAFSSSHSDTSTAA